MRFPQTLGFLTMISIACLAVPVAEARDSKPTLKQIRNNASPTVALKRLRDVKRLKISPNKMNSLRLSAANLSKSLIRVTKRSTEDNAWAELTAPMNRCVDLALKTCGSDRQCGDTSACEIAVEWLDLYNGQSNAEDQYEFEGNCIIALDDDIIFSSCQ